MNWSNRVAIDIARTHFPRGAATDISDAVRGYARVHALTVAELLESLFDQPRSSLSIELQTLRHAIESIQYGLCYLELGVQLGAIQLSELSPEYIPAGVIADRALRAFFDKELVQLPSRCVRRFAESYEVRAPTREQPFGQVRGVKILWELQDLFRTLEEPRRAYAFLDLLEYGERRDITLPVVAEVLRTDEIPKGHQSETSAEDIVGAMSGLRDVVEVLFALRDLEARWNLDNRELGAVLERSRGLLDDRNADGWDRLNSLLTAASEKDRQGQYYCRERIAAIHEVLAHFQRHLTIWESPRLDERRAESLTTVRSSSQQRVAEMAQATAIRTVFEGIANSYHRGARRLQLSDSAENRRIVALLEEWRVLRQVVPERRNIRAREISVLLTYSAKGLPSISRIEMKDAVSRTQRTWKVSGTISPIGSSRLVLFRMQNGELAMSRESRLHGEVVAQLWMNQGDGGSEGDRRRRRKRFRFSGDSDHKNAREAGADIGVDQVPNAIRS